MLFKGFPFGAHGAQNAVGYFSADSPPKELIKVRSGEFRDALKAIPGFNLCLATLKISCDLPMLFNCFWEVLWRFQSHVGAFFGRLLGRFWAISVLSAHFLGFVVGKTN